MALHCTKRATITMIYCNSNNNFTWRCPSR